MVPYLEQYLKVFLMLLKIETNFKNLYDENFLKWIGVKIMWEVNKIKFYMVTAECWSYSTCK